MSGAGMAREEEEEEEEGRFHKIKGKMLISMTLYIFQSPLSELLKMG